MPIEQSEEAKRVLTPEELETLRKAYADFEAQAGNPKKPNGMRRNKTDFPIGILDDGQQTPKKNYDNPLR